MQRARRLGGLLVAGGAGVALQAVGPVGAVVLDGERVLAVQPAAGADERPLGLPDEGNEAVVLRPRLVAGAGRLAVAGEQRVRDPAWSAVIDL